MDKLFSDLKTDEEKSNFFLSGRGYETGVIAQAIQNDVAMAYHRCAEYKKELEAPQPAEPVNEEELLAAREALIDMGYLWDGDQWVDVDPPSKTVEQAPEWPDFARMEASLQRLKERLVFENGRRKDLEQRLREKRNG